MRGILSNCSAIFKIKKLELLKGTCLLVLSLLVFVKYPSNSLTEQAGIPSAEEQVKHTISSHPNGVLVLKPWCFMAKRDPLWAHP